MLNQATDWQIEVDLGKELQFPNIVPINFRPDMITRRVYNDRPSRSQRKRVKYEDLMTARRDSGWQTWSFPDEK